MQQEVYFVPSTAANEMGYALKYTHTSQNLHVPSEWEITDLGNNLMLPSSRGWLTYRRDFDWKLETLNAKKNFDGKPIDPTYQQAIDEYRKECDDNPEEVILFEGTQLTAVLRRTTALTSDLSDFYYN